MVGLTGAILGVISSGALFAGPDANTPEQFSAAMEQKGGVGVPAGAPLTGGVNFTPAAGVFTRDPSDQPAPAVLPSTAPAPQAAVATPPPVTPAQTRSAEQVARVTPDPLPDASPERAAPPEAAAATTGGGTVVAASTPASESEAEAEADSASVWPDNAVDCPRDWVAGADNPAAGDCRDPGAPPQALAAAPSDQSALDEAAAERASEEAGLQFVARLPMARPDYKPPPPAARRKSVTKAGAKRPADPPPKCGSKKRAKWRYVNKIPTWYCK